MNLKVRNSELKLMVLPTTDEAIGKALFWPTPPLTKEIFEGLGLSISREPLIIHFCACAMT